MEELQGRLGETIAKRRKAKGLEQEELARRVSQLLKKKVTMDQISRWERGKNLIRVDVLVAVAAVLEVTLDVLVKGEKGLLDEMAELRQRMEDLERREAARERPR